MKVLDTNLWVFGTLGTHDRAVSLLEAIETGDTTSAINAYMVQEALDAFDRVPGLSATERDELKTVFLTRLTRMIGLVEAPSSRDAYPARGRDCSRRYSVFNRKTSRSSCSHSGTPNETRRY